MVTGGVVVSGDVVVTGGVVVSGDVVVTGGVVVSGDVVVTGGVVVIGGVVVTGGSVVPQPGLVIVFESRVTAPSRASSRPCTSAFVVAVIDARAMIVPTKSVPVPSVAELPTCQNTLHGLAPLISETLLSDAVISVDAAWKMNTALELPCASSVRVPVRPNVPEPYNPANNVCPPSSTPVEVAPGRPAASSYPVLRSAFACAATELRSSITPLVSSPGGNPVMNGSTPTPGLTPTLPPILDGPVFVILEPARTA